MLFIHAAIEAALCYKPVSGPDCREPRSGVPISLPADKARGALTDGVTFVTVTAAVRWSNGVSTYLTAIAALFSTPDFRSL